MQYQERTNCLHRKPRRSESQYKDPPLLYSIRRTPIPQGHQANQCEDIPIPISNRFEELAGLEEDIPPKQVNTVIKTKSTQKVTKSKNTNTVISSKDAQTVKSHKLNNVMSKDAQTVKSYKVNNVMSKDTHTVNNKK